LRKLGNVLAVIAAIVAGLFVLGFYSPGAAAAAFVLLILLFIIATPILGWLLLLWLCRWAGRFLAGDDKALASMIGTGLFVTLLISGLLTSCMLQSQIANGLSRAMMTAAERNADTQERFSPNRTVHGPGNAPVARLRSVP
jgi:membrane-bound acyltransferase YfiQ involved in biofilm formation